MANLKELSDFINSVNRCDCSEIEVEMSTQTGAIACVVANDNVKIKIKPPKSDEKSTKVEV